MSQNRAGFFSPANFVILTVRSRKNWAHPVSDEKERRRRSETSNKIFWRTIERDRIGVKVCEKERGVHRLLCTRVQKGIRSKFMVMQHSPLVFSPPSTWSYYFLFYEYSPKSASFYSIPSYNTTVPPSPTPPLHLTFTIL